jgi:hypothetical protein
MKLKKLENTDTYRRVEAELLPGEELLWVGQPQPRHIPMGRTTVGNKATLIGIIVGLQLFLVLGLLFFMPASSTTTTNTTSTTPETVTRSQGTPWIIISIVVIGLLVGLFVLGFALFRYRKDKHTIYAITDRRVLTISGDAVRSDGEQDIEFIERKMHRDGTGDIIFRREAHTGTAYYGSSVFAPQMRITNVGLFGIPDPHDVEELMLQIFRSDRYPCKRKHDENNWADADDFVADDIFEEELDKLIR